MLTLALPPELEKSLHAIAQEHGKSENDIIQEVLARFVEDQEDIRLAVEALKEPGRIWSMEEVEREFGLDH